MAYLSIESSNPKLSYLIQKKPSESAIAKTVRGGVTIGWWTPKANQYNVIFEDSPQALSYSKEEFDYLDTNELTSPTCYSNLINNLFSSLLKKPHDEDIPHHSHYITLGFIKCNNRYLENFGKFFPGISYEEKAKDIYNVILRGNESLRSLLHLSNLFCVFMMLDDEDNYLDISEDLVAKYLHSVQEVKCPYYIANLFKVRFLKNKALFTKFSSLLEAACTEEVTFTPGNTQDARKRWIESNLTIGNNIVDLGAGEDFNYYYLSKNLTGIYYPIDKDEDARRAISRKITKKELLKVAEPLESWSDLVDILEGDTEVILSEVLEHNSLKEARKLLESVVKYPAIKRVLITLPWKAFNQFYQIPEGNFRHEDHQWEADNSSMLKLLDNLPLKYQRSFSDIGDSVVLEDGTKVSTTLGILIEKV
jgi:hypothetical protein